jgi:hypothetical protein
MSNPLTPIDAERDDDRVGDLDLLEETVDETRDETDEAETAASEAAPTDDEPESSPAEPRKSRSGMGLIALVLGALLLVSIAINLKQSRDVATLESRSQEYQQALAAAVDRIDSEAARADGAEQALDRVDAAVDVVNERVLGLREALDQLREATVR